MKAMFEEKKENLLRDRIGPPVPNLSPGTFLSAGAENLSMVSVQ